MEQDALQTLYDVLPAGASAPEKFRDARVNLPTVVAPKSDPERREGLRRVSLGQGLEVAVHLTAVVTPQHHVEATELR
ncbi:hypothetical protein [Streptomyces sp. NPDC127190]|uniref:hypothetical protein n=1 Tax=unclassified Streptomyces TaxID=2593676 RepID=UPI00363B184B